MTTSDIRASLMLHWLKNDLGLAYSSCQPASSDASFRRYFRVKHAQGSYIVMDAPPALEDIQPFIKVANLLEQARVHVPHIHQQHLAMGFLLLDDFGHDCLLDKLNPETAHALYSLAFEQLFQLQCYVDPQTCDLPLYDTALLSRELSLFYDWFAEKLLHKTIPETLQHSLNQLLIDSALAQPQVAVHRDYHSRNIMLVAPGQLGIIDFQDAVVGPITYDLVSLLRDCYIAWPSIQLSMWINQYFQRLIHAGLINCSLATFNRWFDLMGLQRHLKAIGIFSRLHLRDYKSNYLADIPRTMNYVVQICCSYPELAEFYSYLTHEILPIYQQEL
jgi:aminoglycoside/choline kinase family phosphotransferase